MHDYALIIYLNVISSLTVSHVNQLMSEDNLSTSKLMKNIMDKKFISSSMREHVSYLQLRESEAFYREILISQRRMSQDDGTHMAPLVRTNPFPFLQNYRGYKSHYNLLMNDTVIISQKRLTGNP
jgi:hypothetical protein